MAIMSNIPYMQALCTSGPFAPGQPVGLVLHRTEASYEQVLHAWTVGPNPRRTSAHFLVGKNEYQVIQAVDTHTVANHAKGANPFYVGIEFVSINATPGVAGQDQATNRDILTIYQAEIGHRIVDWVCHTHGIPKVGPPTKRQMMACNGRWHGVLSHNDLTDLGIFPTDHGDEILAVDYMSLGVFSDTSHSINADGLLRAP